MDFNYYEVSSELDAREILRYLNNLGIHNISGEVLKYFITDLKKLIKYDLQHKSTDIKETYEVQGPERLHSASTFSSRIKSKEHEGAILTCSRECLKGKKPLYVRNVHSAPHLGRPKAEEEKPPRRACSCIRVEKKPELTKERSITACSNLIKVTKQPVVKKCDPVSLYHYYTSLWEKYKSNVPGENNWSDLRWSIRQKMAGNDDKRISNKVPDSRKRGKERTNKILTMDNCIVFQDLEHC